MDLDKTRISKKGTFFMGTPNGSGIRIYCQSAKDNMLFHIRPLPELLHLPV